MSTLCQAHPRPWHQTVGTGGVLYIPLPRDVPDPWVAVAVAVAAWRNSALWRVYLHKYSLFASMSVLLYT